MALGSRKRFNAKRLVKINDCILLAEATQKAIQLQKKKEHGADHRDDDQNSSGMAEAKDEEAVLPEVKPKSGNI